MQLSQASESLGNPPSEPPPITGQDVIEWIESNCFIPDGKKIGQPVRLAPWQKRDIERIYNSEKRENRTGGLPAAFPPMRGGGLPSA